MRLLTACTLALLVFLLSCGTSSPPVSTGYELPSLENSGLPEIGSDIDKVSINIPNGKHVSEGLVRNIPIDATHTFPINTWGDVVIDGTTATINSTASEMSAVWWWLDVQYEFEVVPYVAPYEIVVHTDGGGPYWVALADFKSRSWHITDAPFTGENATVEVGLDANAADVFGGFLFAIIGYGGSPVTVNSIDLKYPSGPIGENPLEYNQFLDMEDGTQLATTIYLPFDKGPGLIPPPPYPVVLMRSPYDKTFITDIEVDSTPFAKFVTDLNVVLVLQYFRGRLDDTGAWPDSSGTETLFRDHAGPTHYDAIETMDWIDGRNFYNGQTVLTGPSALGLWIYQAAPELGDRITAFYPQACAGDIGDWAARRNGCFKISNIQGWLNENGFPGALIEEAFANVENAAYWEEVDFDPRADEVTAPGYHETGWWDVDVEASINSWQELQHKGGTGASGNQFLIIGPWSHHTFRTAAVGELTLPTSPAANDATTLPNDWDGLFWLPSTIGRNPLYVAPSQRVLYYMVGENGSTSGANNHWFTADDWPPAYTETTLYFSDGLDGLADSLPANSSLEYTAKPFAPLQTNGGANLGGLTVLEGPFDQSGIEDEPGVITLRTAELGSALTMAGPVTVKVFFELTDANSAVDTDLIIKLIDEYPDGTNLLVADTGVRLSWFVENFTEDESVVPGKVYEIDLEVGQRAFAFEAGHKIGIDIQGTNSPRFSPNPGNGNNFVFDEGAPIDQVCKIYLGTDNPSSLTLPEFNPLDM